MQRTFASRAALLRHANVCFWAQQVRGKKKKTQENRAAREPGLDRVSLPGSSRIPRTKNYLPAAKHRGSGLGMRLA
jgi:hypothetical protein